METPDLVIYGGNPAGIACAVRAAREGLDVLLVNHTPHLGGLPSNGMGLWDTLYEGKRAPIYDEMRQAIFDYYRETYGEDSPQYAACLPGETGHSNGKYEAKVFEFAADRMVEAEDRITVRRSFYPFTADVDGRLVRAVTFRQMDGDETFTVSGSIFVDCSYEGDLLPLTGVEFRVGREGREVYDEPHAGRIFMRFGDDLPESEKRIGRIAASLNLRQFGGTMEIIHPESTGEGDGNVQAMNFRTALSSDPGNRVPPEAPAGYDRDRIRKLLETLEVNLPDRGKNGGEFPNRKSDWNRPQLIEGATDYVHADWDGRKRILAEFWGIVRGMLYYFQTDPEAPEHLRNGFEDWGLAKDEFADNGHMPWEIYVREARRLIGRHVFTQHDVRPADGIERAPIHSDSIGVCEWYLDSHACHAERVERVPDCRDEGKVMLHHQTVPGQIPYRSLLATELDNLLVPVCLSSSHLGQNAVRLEPTWMQIAESAGDAAAQAVKNGQSPAEIDVDELQRTLLERRSMLTFCNDVATDGPEWVPAVQWAGTRGFFPTYDARPDDPLDETTASVWVEAVIDSTDSVETAKRVSDVDPGTQMSPDRFHELLREKGMSCTDASGKRILTRAEACDLLFKEHLSGVGIT